jgi:hypothetical protein
MTASPTRICHAMAGTPSNTYFPLTVAFRSHDRMLAFDSI